MLSLQQLAHDTLSVRRTAMIQNYYGGRYCNYRLSEGLGACLRSGVGGVLEANACTASPVHQEAMSPVQLLERLEYQHVETRSLPGRCIQFRAPQHSSCEPLHHSLTPQAPATGDLEIRR